MHSRLIVGAHGGAMCARRRSSPAEADARRSALRRPRQAVESHRSPACPTALNHFAAGIITSLPVAGEPA
ncbi:hypothetical protein LC55x_5590 [Lysobacter capsici]|nr:hypothetical protein LC55x_5590 [Lysobacter capsici]